MTLITYPSRVHFADDVLEEALHSELERSGCISPLLVYDNAQFETEFFYRVMAGLPRSVKPQMLSFTRACDLSQAAKTAIDHSNRPDIVIAFGSAPAIELGRKCRFLLAQSYGKQPPLYAILGVDGLPGPCPRNLQTWRAGLPSVLICDPTVALRADLKQSRQSVVLSLVRCIESYLANAYNPPADGMALDALTRSVTNLPKIAGHTGLAVQREFMAAALNAALSQEKGVGPALVLAAALADRNGGIEVPDLARLILPSVVKNVSIDGAKAKVLLKVIGGPEAELSAAIERLMTSIPMRSSLSDLGVTPEDISAVAQQVDGKAGLEYDSVRQVLDPVY